MRLQDTFLLHDIDTVEENWLTPVACIVYNRLDVILGVDECPVQFCDGWGVFVLLGLVQLGNGRNSLRDFAG